MPIQPTKKESLCSTHRHSTSQTHDISPHLSAGLHGWGGGWGGYTAVAVQLSKNRQRGGGGASRGFAMTRSYGKERGRAAPFCLHGGIISLKLHLAVPTKALRPLKSWDQQQCEVGGWRGDVVIVSLSAGTKDGPRYRKLYLMGRLQQRKTAFAISHSCILM